MSDMRAPPESPNRSSVPNIHPGAPRPARPWGFWMTLAWAAAGFMAVQFAVVIVVFVWFKSINPELSAVEAANNPRVWAIMAIAQAPLQILVFALLARWRGIAARDYFALVPPRGGVVLGLIAFAILLPVFDGVALLLGQDVVPPFMADAYRLARSEGWLLGLAVAVVVAAPISEEISFRGFMYRGWSQTRLGPWGAIVGVSLVWALLHIQYNWFGIVQVFVLGLLLGWLRFRSGSTLLTIALHAVANFVALIETAVLTK